MSLIILFAFLLHLSGIQAFNWSHNSPVSGLTILVCKGYGVNLTWGYGELSTEHDIDEEWTFTQRANSTIPELLASVFRGHFFTEPNIHQNIQYLQPSGIRLDNATTADDGWYTFRVNVNLNSYISVHETNVSLLVIDPETAENITMQVRRLPDVVFDNQTREFHVQMACAPSSPLGNMPVNVVFETPHGVVLNSTGYSNGEFTVSLPNPVDNGEFLCRVSNPPVTCLPMDASLLRTAASFIDGCKGQLDVTVATLAAARKELEKLKEANQQCNQQLAATTPGPVPCIDHFIYDFACNMVPGVCGGPGARACSKLCQLCVDNGSPQPDLRPTPQDTTCYDRIGHGVTCSSLPGICNEEVGKVMCPNFCGVCP